MVDVEDAVPGVIAVTVLPATISVVGETSTSSPPVGAESKVLSVMRKVVPLKMSAVAAIVQVPLYFVKSFVLQGFEQVPSFVPPAMVNTKGIWLEVMLWFPSVVIVTISRPPAEPVVLCLNDRIRMPTVPLVPVEVFEEVNDN